MNASDHLRKPLILSLVAILGFCLPAHAAPKEVTKTPLSRQGEVLLKKYTKLLDELKMQVRGEMPVVDEAKKSSFMKARAEWNALKEPAETASAAEKKIYTDTRDQTEAKVLASARVLLTDLDGVLASDKWDATLMKIAILTHATPHGMAEFAQAGAEKEKIIDDLLANQPLMKEILEAGGANGGYYGGALQIYAAIQKACERAREAGSIFQRLALGTSLQTPWKIGEEKTGVYGIVHVTELKSDQVERYKHYEKAYLDGELDPAFKDMTTWECRFITDSPYSNEELAWARQMMRIYRPDHISNPDYQWRYARIVKSDVPYGTPKDENGEVLLGKMPELGEMSQQILALGGICGPRAFFGRFSLRAFGIPSKPSTQTGHGALSHWTPDGWTICFGAWWSEAWCGPQGGLDLLLETQARAFKEEYFKVMRAQWIGDALGEEDVDLRMYGVGGGFWDGLAFCKKMALVKDAEMKALELTGGMKLGESDDLLGDEVGKEVEIPEENLKIVADKDGVITIPSVACYSPRKPSDRVLFMKTWDEKDFQLHYSRLGERPELVKYRIEVPAAGEYELTAQLATVSFKQELIFRINRDEPVSHGIPYTKGLWGQMPPLKVKLEEGRNTISITARAPNRGVSFKSFQLKPVK
jgi:hypothetical protein